MAQELKEKTGTVSSYTWPEGEYGYNVDKKEYVNDPSKLFTWTAPETGMGYFFVDDPDYDELWLPNWRFQGESEFRGTNFNVEKGDTIEIRLRPRWYDEKYIFNDNMEMIQWWKFHAQGGSVKYSMTYTETIESSLDADFTYSPAKPTPGQPIQITSTSTVVNAQIISMKWYVNGDHRTEYDNLESWSWTPSATGEYQIELEVKDSTGKSDFSIANISVEEESSYTVLDQAFTTNLQNNEPVNRKTSFTYGEDIYFWLKLGNVKGAHSVYIEWETPRERETLTNTRIEVPSPSTQGNAEWNEYVVYHSITQADSTYNQIINDPGTWTISVWIDSKEEYRYSFTINSNVIHSFEIPKTKYITREKVEIKGSVTKNGAPIWGAEIGIEVFDKDGNILDYSYGFSTGADGTYDAFYEIPLDPNPTTSTRETRTLKITADIDGQYYSVEKQISVMPIWFDVQEITLVQTIESKPYDGYYKLAGGKEAGIRVTFNVPTRRGTSGYTRPQFNVELTVKKNSQLVYSETRPIDGISRVVSHDFFFTLEPGNYDLSLKIDENNKYTSYEMPQDYWKSLQKDWSLVVTEMEPLRIMYVPIDMKWKENTNPVDLTPEDHQELTNYIGICEKHIDFMKDVYPLPESKFTFKINPRNIESSWPVSHRLTYSGQYIAATLWLSKMSVVSNYKIIGVLPANNLWWDKPETLTTQGFASAYISSRGCGIKETAEVGVSSHEVAHLLGLYRWTEQYKIQEHGFPVTGLILKDGRIYDLDVETERQAAFNINTVSVRCFMGDNSGGSYGAWVSQDTYVQLVEALGDPPHVPVLLVGGVINATGLYQQQFTEYVGLPDTWPEGRFTVKLVDEYGGMLYEQDFGGDADEAFFCFTTLFPANTASIEYYKDDILIASEPVSSNPPNVNIDSFNSQGDSATVTWSVSDPDMDQCTSSIVYSNDGENWITLDIELEGTQYSFDYEGLPGGDTCYIKVIGNDGVRTSETIYGTFSVPKNQPHAVITSSVEDEVSGAISLTGVGYDLDDGEITDSLTWSSNMDGVLGTGKSLYTNLSLGVHIISLEVMDKDGNSATAQVNVEVIEEPTIAFESHVVTGTVPQEGSTPQAKSIFLNDETVYSWVRFSSIGIGDNVTWVLTGPGVLNKYGYTTDGSSTGPYLIIDMSEYPMENAIGYWEIEVYVNGVSMDTTGFSVEERQEPTGFVWWGGALGLLVFAAVLGGGYLLLRRRKGGKQVDTVQVPPADRSKQMYCDNCGKSATWIEEYQRWYCYDCEKYLE